ncbi:hypothetical protein ACHAXS_010562 [Conticribra weissflogii]
MTDTIYGGEDNIFLSEEKPYPSNTSCNHRKNISIQVQNRNRYVKSSSSQSPPRKQNSSPNNSLGSKQSTSRPMDPSPTASPELGVTHVRHPRGELIPAPPLAGVAQEMHQSGQLQTSRAESNYVAARGGMKNNFPLVGQSAEKGADSKFDIHSNLRNSRPANPSRPNNLARKLESSRTNASSDHKNPNYTTVTLLSEEDITKDDLQAMKDMIGDIKKDPSLLYRLSSLPGSTTEEPPHHSEAMQAASAMTSLLRPYQPPLDDDHTEVSSLGMMSSGEYYSSHVPGSFPYPMQHTNSFNNSGNNLDRYPSASPSPQHGSRIGDRLSPNNTPSAVAQRRTNHDAEIALRMQSLRAKRGLLAPSTPTQQRLALRARSYGNIAGTTMAGNPIFAGPAGGPLSPSRRIRGNSPVSRSHGDLSSPSSSHSTAGDHDGESPGKTRVQPSAAVNKQNVDKGDRVDAMIPYQHEGDNATKNSHNPSTLRVEEDGGGSHSSDDDSKYSNYPLGETAARAVAAMVAIAQEDRRSPRHYQSGVSKYADDRHESNGIESEKIITNESNDQISPNRDRSWNHRRATEGSIDENSCAGRSREEKFERRGLTKKKSDRRMTDGNVLDGQSNRVRSSSKSSSVRKHHPNKVDIRERNEVRPCSKSRSSRRPKEENAGDTSVITETHKEKHSNSSRTSSRQRSSEEVRLAKGETTDRQIVLDEMEEKMRAAKAAKNNEMKGEKSHNAQVSSSSRREIEPSSSGDSCLKQTRMNRSEELEKPNESADRYNESERLLSSHHQRHQSIETEKHRNGKSKHHHESTKRFNQSSPQLGEFVGASSRVKQKHRGGAATAGEATVSKHQGVVTSESNDTDNGHKKKGKKHHKNQSDSSKLIGDDKKHFSDHNIEQKHRGKVDSHVMNVHPRSKSKSIDISTLADYKHEGLSNENKNGVTFSEDSHEAHSKGKKASQDNDASFDKLHLLQRKPTFDSVSHYEGSHNGSHNGSHSGKSVMSRLSLPMRKKKKKTSKTGKDHTHHNLEVQSAISSEFDQESPKKSTGSDDSANLHPHKGNKGLMSRLAKTSHGSHSNRRQSLDVEALSASIAASSDSHKNAKSAGNILSIANDSATYLVNEDDDALAMSREFAALTGEVPRLCDEKGRCALHPHIRLQKPKLFGGWKIMFKHCPDCAVEHMKRSQKELAKHQLKQREKQKKIREQKERMEVAKLKELREPVDKISTKESKNVPKQPQQLHEKHSNEESDYRQEIKTKDNHQNAHNSPTEPINAPSETQESTCSAIVSRDMNREAMKDVNDKASTVKHRSETKNEKDDFTSNLTTANVELIPSQPIIEYKKPKHKKVNGLPWSDYNGQSGRYTGEVNDQYLPHGKGEMVYDRGVVTAGVWYNGVLDTEAPVTEEKYVPDRLSYYSVGDKGRQEDMLIESKRATSAAVATIRVNDAAFVRRSDGTWTYAVVKDRTDGDNPTIRFKVNARGSTKAFPISQWGTYVRRIKRKADAPATKVPSLDDFLQNNRSKIGSSNSVQGNMYSSFSDSASVSSAHSAPMMNRNQFMGNLTTGRMKIPTRSRSRSRNRKNVTTLPLLFSSSMSVSEETEGQDNDDWETASGSGYRLRGIDP